MKNVIYLIKVGNQRVIPALCINVSEDYFEFAQIRQANYEDIFNNQDRATMEKQNKGKPDRDHIKIREKYEIDTVYIGKPEGLKSKSVVMVKKLHNVNKHHLIKEIAKVTDEVVVGCRDLINQINKTAKLHEEMQLLKKKIQLASFNNENYTKDELRIDEILNEIGYPRIKKRKKKPYQNLREVPNKGYIKIYHGGR